MILKLFKSSRLTAVNNILFQTDFKGKKIGFIQSVEFFKNRGICPSNRWKVWKIEKEMVKSFFESYIKCFTSEIFFLLVKIYSISLVHLQCIVGKALVLLFKRSILLTSLINLSLEKEITVFVWRSVEKILNFGSKNLYKPSKRRLSYKVMSLII